MPRPTDGVSFRPMGEADLELLHHWLNQPHVLEWWREPLTLAATREKYGPYARGEVLTFPFLILWDGHPIGYVQWYRIADHPEYAVQVQVEEGAAGIDLFIGEPERIHRGLGALVIRRFLWEVVFPQPGVTCCVIGPDQDNRAAIRCYEKAGFRYLKTVQVQGEPAPEYLMRLDRTDLA